ncbi:MAG: hypothetical protein R2827_01160 [Bdellovibrionales bacterium]
MASPTKRTKIIRRAKIKRTGQKRKGQVRQQGTTKSSAELFGDNE